MEDFTLEKNPVKISLIFWCRIKNTKTHSDPYKMHALKSGLNFKNVYICFFFRLYMNSFQKCTFFFTVNSASFLTLFFHKDMLSSKKHKNSL